YNTGGIAGPERAQTWVNQPEKMHGSKTGTPFKPGQARYGNAVYVYKPDFNSNDYKEGVVHENPSDTIFEFQTPYIIGATPPNKEPWGIYKSGCRNGLVLNGKINLCRINVSVDRGRTWQDCGAFHDGLDLTDRVKGRRQYQIKFGVPARDMKGSNLTITT